MNSTKTRERVSSHGLYIDMKYIATDKIKYRCTLQIPSKISKNISIVTWEKNNTSPTVSFRGVAYRSKIT
jgi:hypothetical protein